MNIDLEALVKDAVLFGLGVGTVAAALFMIWAFGEYLAAPKVTVAAAAKPRPFGIHLPE